LADVGRNCSEAEIAIGAIGGSRPSGPVKSLDLLNRIDRSGAPVSSQEIDDYLASLGDPKRRTLVALRQSILEALPDAEEGMAYGLPAFRIQGKVIAGFAAFKNHLSYLPHSGSVFPQMQEQLAGYQRSTGALRFPIDEPLPQAVVSELIEIRLKQALG
jgi:uncharacterized protein YdhG (YjbR/CyaY superfamily)